MLDLIIRNARLPRAGADADIAVANGRVVEVAARIDGEAAAAA